MNSKPSELPNIDIYIYCEHKGNFKQGEGAYYIILECYTGRVQNTKSHFGGFKETGLKRLQLLTCIEALKHVNKPCNITIHINSPYVAMANYKKEEWLREDIDKRKNSDLLKTYYQASEKHNITISYEKETIYHDCMKEQLKLVNFSYVIDFQNEFSTGIEYSVT